MAEGSPTGSRRLATVGDLVVAAAAGAVYWWSLLPGLGYAGDTAIFQFVGRVLGLPHGPGYPLYLALNHVWVRLLPFGSLAYRSNLLSAALAALACVLLHRLLRIAGVGPLAAVAGALIFAYTPVFWSQAIVAEVYSLHAAMVAATLLGFLAWSRRPGRRGVLVAACAVYAFSFGNHLTTVTLLPALAWLVWRTDRRVLREPRTLAAVAGVTALAACQYLYLPWRTADPTTPYLGGQISDLATFVDYVTGGSFRARMFAFTPWQMVTERLSLLVAHLARAFGPFLVAAPLGWSLLRKRGPAGTNATLALAAAGNAVFALGYDIGDLEPFFIPTDLAVAVWIGAGVHVLLDRLPERPALVRAALAAALPAALVAANLTSVSRRDDRAIEGALEATLAALPPDGAAVLTPNYPMSAFLWYQLIGRGWQERGVYLMPHYFGEGDRDIASFVRSYAVDGRPYRVVEQRLEVPPGLPVFCFCSAEQRRSLVSGGFELVPYLPDLWWVRPAPSVSSPPERRPEPGRR